MNLSNINLTINHQQLLNPPQIFTNMQPTLIITSDLIFSTKIDTIANITNTPITYNPENIKNTNLILVDLNHKEAFTIIQQHPNKCIAFGSHVDTIKLNKAKELGCNKVLPRSKFFEDLPNLFKDQ